MEEKNKNQAVSSLKSEELGISDYQNPFGNCKLNRKQEGETLTKLVGAYNDGFTMAINGSWGSGKTTFIKMWQQDLKNNGHETILLNAWENDFVSEPLVAILGEIKILFEEMIEENSNKIKEQVDRGLETINNNWRELLGSLVKEGVKLIPIVGEGVVNLGEEFLEQQKDAFTEEINSYSKKKESIQNFRLILSRLVATLDKKPLVFIIDELDRCRPDYAVELLEKVKHFFSVDGIVFVLAIDKEQLSASVRGHYGSDTLNAEEYLRRFIDLEYTLKEPDIESFCNYLCEQLKLENLTNNSKIKTTLVNVYYEKKLSLRQLEKLHIHIKSALELNGQKKVNEELFVLLIYVKLFYPVVYTEIALKNLSTEELVDKLNEIFSRIIKTEDDDKSQEAIYPIIELIYIYSKSLNPKLSAYSTKIIRKLNPGGINLNIYENYIATLKLKYASDANLKIKLDQIMKVLDFS